MVSYQVSTCMCYNDRESVYYVFSLIVFLVHPVSTAAIESTTVEFTCTVNGSEDVGYRVNGTLFTSAEESLQNMGFDQLTSETFDASSMTLRRNLSVTVSSEYNNTDIQCRADEPEVDDNVPVRSSDIAILTVQGMC